MSLLTCENLTFAYDGTPVLTDVSFTVEAGDYLCILGENGSGKSTLLRGLLDLLKPASGRITRTIKKTEIGYLPQQTQVQRDFPATVTEVVRSGCRKDQSKLKTALELLGITNLAKTSYRALSGGQQQRVLLARALCAAESLLFLDEPAAGLDPIVSAELYRIIRELNAKGLAVVMVTHDVKTVGDATKILHLAGKPLFCGTAADYLKSDVYRAICGKGERE